MSIFISLHNFRILQGKKVTTRFFKFFSGVIIVGYKINALFLKETQRKMNI